MSQTDPQHKSSLKSKLVAGGLLTLLTAVLGLATALINSGAVTPFLPGQKTSPVANAPSPSSQTPASAPPSQAPASPVLPSVDTAPSPSPAQNSERLVAAQTVTAKGVRFDNQGCKRQTSTVICSFLITAQDKDKSLQLYPESRLIDRNGQQYVAQKINFGGGNQSALVKDVALRADLTFENVPQSVDQLTLVELRALSDIYAGFFTAQFRDVAISP